MHRSQRDVYDGRMEVVATAPGIWQRRVLPLACGCALAGAAAVVALNDPSAPGSRFPPCAFRALTGLWCPGCGLTRGFHQLFNGDISSALSYNVFVPLVLVAVVASWWGWVRSGWGRSAIAWPPVIRQRAAVLVPVALVVYGVLRNLPFTPLRALAP